MSRKTAIIVGNGELPTDLSPVVDAADFVLRFNEPKLSVGMSGTRTDLLMLATSSKPMQRRLRDPAFYTSPTFQAAKSVMLVYHPAILRTYHPKPNILSWLKGRRSDWTQQTIERVGSAGKEIRIMPPQFYKAGCTELGLSETDMHRIFPSTGYFGLYHCLQQFSADQWDIKLCGFSWEGWKRHSWDGERQWVANHVAEGRLTLIEP
ncbi:glycosyltransferase family 29 protein [Rhizobium tumorigenes]|uniref:glycosyltransferase family 29 protein n=1 Tax=Rhizobium tumorigenes TaxID=2041385 RepID=UPI00241EE62B|nr:glycosyltransferase family 29 protein [Rhizobium tumorigenes]WFS01320.1 glycosyltransferase family 29 protein [Rhizobium tumorigenes]